MFRKFLIVCALAAVCYANDSANRLFREGQRAEKAGDRLHAYLLYVRAAELDPSNGRILERKMALQALTELSASQPSKADVDAATAAALAVDDRSPGEIPEAGPALPPPSLKAPPGTKSFKLRGNAQNVIEQVASAFGIQVVFETGYQPGPAFNFYTGELSMEEAFRALEQVTNSLVVPVNEHLAFVVRDTPQRRADTSPAMSVAIPIPERIAVQEAQEIVTAVQQTLEIRHIAVDPQRRMVYLRDTVGKVAAARQLFSQLSRLRAQVEVEVDLLAVTKTSALNIGLNLQTSSIILNFGNFLNNLNHLIVPSTFTQFLAFGGGKTLFGLGVTEAQAFANITRSSAETILKSDVLTLDGQAASLHVGDRYPIITNGYYGETNGTGTVYSPPPTITFEDLGLVLKVTPTLHDGGEMSLDVEAEFNVLGTSVVNGIPDIAQRKYQGKVRMRQGEWAVLAGLASDSQSTVSSGFAFLSNIPLLGRLFRQDTTNKDSGRILIVLKPRIVNLPPWDFPTKELWVGTESKPLSMF